MECVMECCSRIEMENVSFFVEKLELLVTREWDQGYWNYSYCVFIPRDTLIPSLKPKRIPTLLPVSLESLDPSVFSPQWKCLLRGGGDTYTLHLPTASVERLINHLQSFSIETPIQSRYFLLLRVHGGVITFSSLQDETLSQRIVLGIREYQALYLDQTTNTLIPCTLTRCRYESLPWTTQNVLESNDRLQLSQCYYIQHLNHSVVNGHEYYVITEQSIIQHGILKDIENKENENTISSVASLLSNIPQCACTECDVPGEVFLLSHCEYQQIQTAYCHCLFHNLVFTPSSLIHYLHDSDVFWLIGLLVDYTPSNQNGFSRIRLRDLTSDIIIQLSCEEWVERFPLGSIVCVTNLSCKNGDRIVFSKFSSIFCIPQTEFLQSILPSPPRTLSYPLSPLYYSWQSIEVELVLSLRVFSICTRCRKPVTNNHIHSYICPQGNINKSMVFVELSFLGSCGITKVKGYD